MNASTAQSVPGLVTICRHIALFSIMVVLIGAGPSVARAEALKVAIPEIPPFGFLDADKKATGIYAEFAQGICAKAGVECTLMVAPLARTVAGLGDGTYDMLVIQETPKVVEVAEKLVTTIDVNNIAVGAKGTTFAAYDALKGKKFANLRGFNYQQQFTDDPDIKKVETTSYQMNVEMVMAGRVDGLVIPDTALFYTLQSMGLSRDDLGPPLVLKTGTVCLFYAKSVKNPEISAKLVAAGEALRAEDYFYKVRNKYIPAMK